MSEEKKRDPRTVQLKRVRLSFTDTLLTKAAAVAGGKESYNCNIIIPMPGGALVDDDLAKKFGEQNRDKVIAAMKEAGEQKFGKADAYKTIAEDSPKRVSFRKGERFKNADGEVYKGYEGNWAISASGPQGGKRRPKVFDRYKEVVSEADFDRYMEKGLYSGCYVDVIVSFYGHEEGGRGIFCSIESIRSHERGDRLGGGGYQATADDWDDLDDDDDDFAGDSSSGGGSGSSDSDFQ